MKKNIFALAALLMASAAVFTACSSDDSIADEQPAAPSQPTYTMTIEASKGGPATNRALSLDGKTLNATWAAGEQVTVYNVTKSAALDGYLEAQSTGASTTLNGSLTGTVEAGDALRLSFLSPSYSAQDGTLAYIAANCDYAVATVTVASVDGGNITTNAAAFANQQAIVKFTLIDKADGTTPLSASQLVINDGTTDYTINPTSATNEIYAAIPGFTGQTVTLTATVGGDTYTYEKASVSFTNGKYYEITVKMTKQASPYTQLSTIASDYTAQDGETLTGTLANNVKISIADGATVTLKDVNINGSGTWTSGNYAGITCEGDATITLEGTNTVKGFYEKYPGIFVSSGKTLVINGTGELNASSNGSADTGSGGAGIGGGDNMNCGNIEIQSGTVTATGNKYGAGIGGGQNANCGNITISGGTVTATGGYRAAGIGGGRRGASGTLKEYDSGSCGNITISGGTITATGGENAAGIGGGRGNNNNMKSSCGTITITSGVTSVTATKGSGANSIGAGAVGICGSVTIAAGANVTQK